MQGLAEALARDPLAFVDAEYDAGFRLTDAERAARRRRQAVRGAARAAADAAQAQDGIEPVRRMVKWITDECADPHMMEAQAAPAVLQPA